MAGQWQYLYRAIDRDGTLVDVYLSGPAIRKPPRRLPLGRHGHRNHPGQGQTDKHASYPPALDEVFCDDVEHRTSKYLNNHLEQDHRG